MIASCSFGKDSIAAIITHIKHGGRVGVAAYCRIMFDDRLSAELPEHEEWIHAEAIPRLERDWGVKTTIIHPRETYEAHFYRRYKKGNRKGRFYGFPFRQGPWCTSHLKCNPLDKHKNQFSDAREIIGIAADEPNRMPRKRKDPNVILPLAHHGITQDQAFEIAGGAKLLSPAYDKSRVRLGCWFCHNQSIGELRRLRKEYPDLWQRMLALDKDSPRMFTPDWTVRGLDKRFEMEDRQMTMFGAEVTIK